MEMPLKDADQVVRLAKRFNGLRSNIRTHYAFDNVPERHALEWRRTLKEEEHHQRLTNLNADTWLCEHLATANRGYLTRAELEQVARWKYLGGRTRKLIEENSESEVREISSVSFAATSERLRIGALLSLRGVDWPMASTILHFVPVCVFPERAQGGYPILDKKTMAAIRGSTSYNFQRWMEYTKLCRDTAQTFNVTLRELDRALWICGDRVHAVYARKP